MKAMFITSVLVYISISLPAILGIGYVIDWVPEATWYQKFIEYLIEGLLNNILIKTIIASLVGIVVSLVIPKRRYSK
ncbi:hypothetical protein CSV80_16050 [Sporosarcina sp. P12(2017)]|nr:hypothetical protein CSV81_07075 [Sporosarcina sp. P10]PIC59453.1 hypothetical protein CSV80_16050 [Sporosarcina sp. P12(2017)]